MKKKIILIWGAFLCASAAQADNGSQGQPLASVVTISREELQDFKALDLAEVLRLYAGLSVSRTGGVAQPAQLSVRGSEPNQTVVLVDGIRINSGNTGLAALQDIKLEMVERIEIIKGAQSALYGSGATGGVINIITRQPAVEYKSLSFMTGSGGARQPTLQYHVSGDDYRAGISLLGYASGGEPNLLGSTVDNALYNNGVNVYYKTQLGPVNIGLNGWLQKGNTEYVEPATQIKRNQDFDNEFFSLQLGGNFSAAWHSTLRLSQMLAQDHVHHRAPGALDNDVKTTILNTLEWQNEIALSEVNQLKVGLLVVDDKSSARIDDRPYNIVTASKAIYLQDRFSIDKHRALIAVRQTDSDAFGGNTSWNLEYGYQLTADTEIVALSGAAYREPNAIERMGVEGNLDLKAERSTQAEVALRHTFSASHTLSVALFQQRTKALIQLNDAASAFVNRGVYENQGVEINHVMGGGAWGTRVDLVIQQPKDRATGNELGLRAKNSLTTQLYYQTTNSRTALQFVAVGPRKIISGSAAELGGYGLVNLSSRKMFGKRWRLQGKLENLTDKRYQTVAGYGALGRAAYVDLEWLF